MNEEEAIKSLQEYIEKDNNYNTYKKDKTQIKSDFELFCEKHCQSIETILNMLEKKDKIIDLMAATIDSLDSQLVICKYKDKEDVKRKFLEYYEEEVENKIQEEK